MSERSPARTPEPFRVGDEEIGLGQTCDVQLKVILQFDGTLMEHQLVLSVREDSGLFVDTSP